MMETETLPMLSNLNFGNVSPVLKTLYKRDAEMVRNFRELDMNDVTNKVSYRIVPIAKNDREKVIHFLRKFFFQDEPLNVAVGLLDEPHSTCPELEEYCLECLSDGLSLAAISQSGFLVGICLNGLITRGREQNDDSANRIKYCQNQKFKKILKLLTTIKKDSDVFGRFPKAERILDIIILSVDESCRGQGICKALVEKTKELALENNMSLIKVDCSSHYSAKAAARLGFYSIYTLFYEEYVDEEGKRIFNTKSPHTCASTYVLSLNM